MKLTIFSFFRIITIFLLCLFFPAYISAQSPPVGSIYNLTDEQINGFAYDPTCPNVPAEVHIYHGDKWLNGADRPTMCTAKYSCVWPGICPDLNGNGLLDDGHGFWCTPRHPLNTSYITDPDKLNYKIAVVSKCRAWPEGVTWIDTQAQTPLIIKTVVQNRENDTIFIDKPLYKIGISKRFGGAVAEYYNKNGSVDDAAINLVKPAAGEALQSTVFGKYPVGSGKDCFGHTTDSGFGIQGPVYNPTQTGSYCGIPNPSQVETCFTNDQPVDCNNLINTTAQKIGFQTHYRNFTYPLQSNEIAYRQYQPYDDIWGKIDYTFTDNFIQIDYDIWKTGNTTYGSAIQQIPIAFLNNLTKFTYLEAGIVKTLLPTLSTFIKYPIQNNTDGRWFTGVNASFTASDGSTVNPEPQNTFLTMAMYSGKVENACPQRYMQINNVPFGFGNTYLTQVETTTVTAQNYLEFEVKPGNHIRARAYIFPYYNSDILPGTSSTLGDLLSKPESNGGFVPSWECNYSITPTITTTPIPTDTPIPLTSTTIPISPTSPAIASTTAGPTPLDFNTFLNLFKTYYNQPNPPYSVDLNNNGRVEIFDYNKFISN